MPGLIINRNKAIPKRVSLALFFCLCVNFAFAQSELPVSAVSASSYTGSSTAAKTIDKNLATYWQGALSKSFWWLTLDLGKSCSLSKISIFWNKDSGATNYAIQASTNNTTWVNLYSNLSSAGGSVNPYQKDYNLSGFYRYVRLYINKAQKLYSIIYEVKLYGVSPDAAPPTGTVKINNNTQYTNTTFVTLNLSAQDNSGGSGMGNGAQMQFSNDSKTWPSPETYTITKAWTLLSGDGTKTVYVKFKDAAGNWSQAYSDAIILDTTKPAITITMPQNGAVITGP